jgi:hypothetical protein
MKIFLSALVLALSSLACLAEEPAASNNERVKLPSHTWHGTGCKGEAMAALMGCPFDQGSPFVIRVRLEKGLQLPSHSYPVDVGVTVLDGALEITFIEDGKKRTVTLRAGQFFKVPAYAFHTAHVIEKTELQDSGIGPLVTTWEHEKCAPEPAPDPLLPFCAPSR